MMRNNNGNILIMAVVLAFVSILMGVAFLTYAVTLHDSVATEIARGQAVYDAHAAVWAAIAARVAGRPISAGFFDFYEQNKIKSELFSAGNDEGDINNVTDLAVTGYGYSEYEGNNVTAKITANYSDEYFSDFLYITGRERDSVRHVAINFWSHDTVDGKVHSNDTLHIQPGEPVGPVFLKRVTSSCPVWPRNNQAVWRGGFAYRPKIVFPGASEIRACSDEYYWFGTASPDSLTQIAISGNRIYHRKCGIYHHNGTDSLRCDPSTIGGSPYILTPPSGCLYVRGKCMIEANRANPDQMGGEFPERPGDGESFISSGVSGQLTIASSDTMIIGDNIIYTHARRGNDAMPNSVPTTIDSCPDMLGLVSERWIMISRLARDTTYINAALAAVVGSISVQDIYNSSWPTDNEKQSLVIWGSLAQRNKGIVHTTDYPVGHLRGFIEKDYHYDQRFLVKPPPHYLKTGAFDFYFHEPLFSDVGDGGN